MDPFQNFNNQFNPQLYESSNVPPSTDKLFSFSGFQAGLMTNNANMMPSSSTQHIPPQQQQPPQHQFGGHPPPLQQNQFPPQQQPVANNFALNPVPTNMEVSSGGTRYSGMYANTGFDMLSLLSRVVNR